MMVVAPAMVGIVAMVNLMLVMVVTIVGVGVTVIMRVTVPMVGMVMTGYRRCMRMVIV